MRQRSTQTTVNLMLISTFLLWFSLYTYPAFLAVYAKEAGATPLMAGAIVGSYGLVQTVLRIPLGIYSDMIKRRRPFMIIGMLAAAVSALAFVYFKSPVGMLIARGVAGMAATTWVSYSVLYSSLFDEETLASAMGRISSVQYGSQLLAMLLGAYLSQHLSHAAAFWLAAAASAAGVFIVFKIRDHATKAAPQTLRALVLALNNRKLLVATGLSVVFHFVCWGTILGFTGSWASDVVKMDNAQLGLLAAMYLLPNLIVTRISGRLSKKFGRRQVIAAGFLIDALACVLFSRSFSPLALYGAQVLFGLGMALMVPLFISDAIADIEKSCRGAAMGFYQAVYGLGMFVGPMVAGAVIERFSQGGLMAGYTANFYVMAAVSLGGALISLVLIRRGD